MFLWKQSTAVISQNSFIANVRLGSKYALYVSLNISDIHLLIFFIIFFSSENSLNFNMESFKT